MKVTFDESSASQGGEKTFLYLMGTEGIYSGNPTEKVRESMVHVWWKRECIGRKDNNSSEKPLLTWKWELIDFFPVASNPYQ